MQVSNTTNVCTLPESEPTVHIHVQQTTVQSQPIIQPISILRPEHISLLKYLTLNILMPVFHVTPRDIYALSRISKVFKQKLLLDQEQDSCLDRPSSFLNICRVRCLLSNTAADPIDNQKILTLLRLERSLGDVQLRPFPYIHHLEFNSQWLQQDQETSHALTRLRNYTALRSLTLPYFSDNDHRLHSQDDYFIQMIGLTQLHHLSLKMNSSKFTPDNSLERLTHLTSLKSLEIETEIENADQWQAVAKLPSIETLDLKLSIRRITDVGLNALYGLTALRSLHLEKCRNISAARLAPLAARLQTLEFYDDGEHLIYHPEDMIFLQNQDAYALRNFTSLQKITLRYCKITDIALVELNKLITLKSLELMYTGATIEDLAQLHGLTALRELKITVRLQDDELGVPIVQVNKLWQLPALQTATIMDFPVYCKVFTRP